MRIEPLTADRIEAYHGCIDAVARERRWLASTEAPPLQETRPWATRFYLERGFPCFLALDAERVVGWADAHPLDRSIFAHVASIGMGVLSSHRGGGLGTRLLGAVIAAARAHGIERLELQVFADNAPAQALYHKHGFVVEGVKRRAKKLDGAYDDIVLMALLLDASA
jgi:RimJ/RimL family protein N-acetyltransferase